MQAVTVNLDEAATSQPELFARQLAEKHTLIGSPVPNVLLSDALLRWSKSLHRAYRFFRTSTSKEPLFARAGEWMLDNYYIVEETLRQIKQDLPPSYYQQLPKLAGTSLKHYPRIFALAREWVAYSQCQIDLSQLGLFVHSYQQVSPLTTGELWALPIMLRLALIENMSAAAADITNSDVLAVLTSDPLPELSFDLTPDGVVAACFISLRQLAAHDWKTFFEETSRVEQILRGDPAGIYELMDFETRNSYHRVIEDMARHSTHGEESVAQLAVDLAWSAGNGAGQLSQNGHNSAVSIDRITHVGFYLIDEGRTGLERAVRYSPTLSARVRRWILAHPITSYFGSISLFALPIVLGLLVMLYLVGGSLIQLVIVGLLGFMPAAAVAINLVNRIITRIVPPRTLPRMDFSEAIPAEYRTIVVIPTLITSLKEVDSLLQELELHFLRNPDPNLAFALLSDFADAPAQQLPEDASILERAATGTEALNHKYAARAPFYLFHRERAWNPSEGVWMGWERKRGKLHEFNRVIMGSGSTSYTRQVGELDPLHETKYVITLDADTVLPQGSARRLIATLAHPLNRAEFAADGRSVIAGYTVLQPRVGIKPTSSNKSPFTRIFAGDTGIDLYTLAVSEVYQDLFGEGSYVGKGIYDVAAFERSLAGQVGENTLLSHDLFEGIYGRTALVTDVILLEDYPARYLIFTRRLRRWIRGDWQLLPWLLPNPPSTLANAPKRLSVIDRWKIFDNLRRSLFTPTLLVLLVLAWLWLPGSPTAWTLLLATPLITIVADLIAGVGNIKKRPYSEVLHSARTDLVRWALGVVFLPYDALLHLGAIATTLIRLFIIKRRLLQWTTAASMARAFRANERAETWREMGSSLLFAALLGLAVMLLRVEAAVVALPLIAMWLASPLIAHQISQPIIHTLAPLADDQRQNLRTLARRTWAFFERYVGPDDHWLPPDHFQESPRGIIAHQTSPTNIGMLVLSTLAAFDLGYISLLGLAARLQSTFESMDALERYRGHFLNWYDTRTLEPLLPRYVSTVDSGNLAACLLALRQGCDALLYEPLVSAKQWQGLLDILAILTGMLEDLATDQPDLAIKLLEADLDDMRIHIAAVEAHPDQWVSALAWLSTDGWGKISQRLMNFLEAPTLNLDAETLSGLRLYIERLHHHMMSLQRSIDLLVPWLTALDQLPSLFSQQGGRVADAWSAFETLAHGHVPHLSEAAQTSAALRAALAKLIKHVDASDAVLSEIKEAKIWCLNLDTSLVSAQLTAQALVIGYQEIANHAEATLEAMDFAFLFDEQRQVFHIGYNVLTEKLDANFYDLLASEARIASLVAVVKGDIPHSHWLHLGRPVTKVNGDQVLLSWSGTMFEYLMPVLLTRNYEGTFLSDSCYTAVEAQIAYGHEKHVPWGISESGYYAFDANLNYQYQAFGVPQLGFKRNLSDDLVVSPYASLLALSIRPQEVISNLADLDDLGMVSRYGLYEAIDYTKNRLPPNQPRAIVKSYMAHHQGMILLALDNYLVDNAMVRRFHSDARIQSIELLLQEKVPQDAPIQRPHQGEVVEARTSPATVRLTPWSARAESPVPQVHVLSQGQYSVLITSAGGGYSQWQDLALTRWQADTTLDQDGSWIYLQDRDSGMLWSATHQPTAHVPEHQEVLFYPHKVEFRRSVRGISLDTQITLGAEGVEIRRVTVLNDSSKPRRLKVTSYGEVVIGSRAGDQRHPAFSKLFIESEYLPDLNALLFRRRPRSAHDETPYLLHSLVVERGSKITGEYESDRARFVGRGQSMRAPAAFENGIRPLSGTVGATLDPIMSLAQEIDLEPHSRIQLTYLTLAAPTRDEALTLARRYQTWQTINQAFVEARHRSEVELAELGIKPAALEHIQQLLSALIYPSKALRAEPQMLANNHEGQSSLWRYGISGDYPILLVHSRSLDEPLISEVLQAYAYWRKQNLKINLVILNQQPTGYSSDLRNHLLKQLAAVGVAASLNQREGIFLLDVDQIRDVDRVLLETAARAILDGERGPLAAQVGRLSEITTHLPDFTPSLNRWEDPEPTQPLKRPTDLQFDNGLGGFSPDGREYIIYLEPDQATPHPWINVVANQEFGFLVSEVGSGSTWAANSGENRLTAWRNDPISDMPSEVLYLRDEETAKVWSVTRRPAGEAIPTLIRHGAGYSIFEQQSHGLKQQMSLFAVPDAPVKVVRLRLENLWSRPRRVTATYYAEWVLGTTRDVTQQYIVPEFDSSLHALLASNPYNTEFGERVAFLAASKRPHGLTTDREEFLGRMGTLANPAALGRIGLASTVRAGSDPCAAIQLHIDLAVGQSEEIFFLIGEGADRDDALALIRQVQDTESVEAAWQATQTFWDAYLGAVTVNTPEPAMNLMLNRWLMYQTTACRLWGRSALYQSSGAYGFRDQLQDVMAVMHTQPSLAREQILQAAAHQFEAGDVLHWWHPPSGRGVRTRISDDLLWLPYVTAHYVALTGDTAILNESIPFLKGDPLKPDEEERYGQYQSTAEGYSLFEHCRRTIKKGATTGAHGLPLMGAGDWNDGMNRVGIEGRGESIWLGWFLYATLMRFASLCEGMNDDPTLYREQAGRLAESIEAHGWDGEWYRRASYDDGWPLGSSQNKECQIDAIAQSWAVLSGAGEPLRAESAMKAASSRLVKDEDRLILLFDPPFDKTARDPGYIKGYPPGIRENGGQYTHAATWTAWAFAALGDGDRAEELFRLLNPIYQANSPEKAERYEAEPYVLAADIYSAAPHTGRGGWTWYTGSSGWMYRLGIEAILGLNRIGNTLQINPCIPKHWSGFEMTYRFGKAEYHIVITNPDSVNRGVRQVMLDGVVVSDSTIPLIDSEQPHEVHIQMGH